MRARQQKKDPFQHVREWQGRRDEQKWWHSFELPDGTLIRGACSLEGLRDRIARFPISQDLNGQRVLDIGTWDGWFAFEMERRGAEVVAIDNWDNPRFHEIHARLHSRVDYRQMDVYDLIPERIGRFDIVLFMGVLYHLKHPLLALERVCALTTDMAAVDSFILREVHRPASQVDTRPIMEFYETSEFGGQTDNWVAPSLPCLLAFCRTAGFARVELSAVLEFSACVSCYRTWKAAADAAPEGPAVTTAFHNRDFGMNFQSVRDEYLTAWFESPKQNLTLDDLKPEVGGYGTRPIALVQREPGWWETTFKLPPGLAAGFHKVAVRIGDSRPGAGVSIAVDLPAEPQSLHMSGVGDGTTWRPGQIERQRGNTLSLWVAGLPDNADRNNVRIYLSGRLLDLTYLEKSMGQPARQINAEVPDGVAAGMHSLEVAVGKVRSPAVEVLVL
jgi:tRNA (mo5U34)-methyltransferase